MVPLFASEIKSNPGVIRGKTDWELDLEVFNGGVQPSSQVVIKNLVIV